jgi:hypothetical protein
MARPSKLTPQLEAAIMQSLRLGNTRTAACKYVGLSLRQFERWMKSSVAFCRAVEQAEGAAQVRVVGRLIEAIDGGSVRAMIYWLSCRGGPEWKPRTQVDVEVSIARARAIARELGLDPEEVVAEAQAILDQAR